MCGWVVEGHTRTKCQVEVVVKVEFELGKSILNFFETTVSYIYGDFSKDYLINLNFLFHEFPRMP